MLDVSSRSGTTDDTAGMFAAVNGDVRTPKDAAESPPPAIPTGWRGTPDPSHGTAAPLLSVESRPRMHAAAAAR